MTTDTSGSFSTPEQFGDDDSQGDRAGHLLGVLRRRAKLILICTVAAGLAALAFSLIQEPKYEATSSLLFRQPQFGVNIFGEELQTTGTVDQERQAATNLDLVNQGRVRETTAKAMGDDFDAAKVESEIEAGTSGDSDVITITATDPDPETAKKLANAYAASVVAYRAFTDRQQILRYKARIDRAIDSARSAGEDPGDLETGSKQLGILASVQTGNVEMVQAATVPTSQSSPKTGRNTVFGLIAGLIIGLLAAFAAERFDRRLRNPDDIETAFGLPVLGVVPETEDIAASNRGEPGMHLPFAAAESFRMVRASLRYFSVDHEVKVVMVTSEVPEEGKSTVAWNLANVAALSGSALLIETDLRRPSLSRQHGISPSPGLAEYLTNQVDLEAITQKKSVLGKDGKGSNSNLDVIAAGTPPPNPSELLESKSMAVFLESVRSKYDLVVIDTAPVGVVSDSLALGRLSDGVLIVSRIDKSTRDSATRLKRRFQRSEVPILGVIANGLKPTRFGGYGSYGYGLEYDYSSETPRKESASAAT
ncbi:MAG: polysaccharide biosynthesis tyrosine autokinase [Solirubrobacterales bacterium]|nr:polysaccharide biosynthesis tyrosine autokinase [Solirubrobacterales bacterium]